MTNAYLPRSAHAAVFALALSLAYSCGSPVPLEELGCPCLTDQGYVCCAATGKCIRPGTTCGGGADAATMPDVASDSPVPDTSGGAGGSSSGGTGGTGGGGATGGTGGGGGATGAAGGRRRKTQRDSSTANELTVDRWTPMSNFERPFRA